LFSFATSSTGIACNDRDSNSPYVSILLVLDRRSSRAMHFLLPLAPNWRSAALPELKQLEIALVTPAAQSTSSFKSDAIVLFSSNLYK
jgi:hypothetical protein